MPGRTSGAVDHSGVAPVQGSKKPSSSSSVTVPAGGDLQAALKKGGVIQLEAGATYTGAFVARVPGTRLKGEGAKLAGARSPALVIAASDIQVENIEASSPGYDQSVIRLGSNDNSQTTREQEPSDIVLKSVRVPTHRGKRAFEINARKVLLENCSADDVWDPAGRDSQGIVILNSSGDIRIIGGSYTAGSENIMVGGDTIKLAGVETTNILIENVDLAKPLSWHADKVNRNVKNIFELKAGVDVTLRNVRMRGSWVASQTGEGVVITPRNGRLVDRVVIEDSVIEDVGSGLQIMGRDYSTFTNGALHFTMRRTTVRTNRKTYGGQGRVASISGEPAHLEFRDNLFLNDGDASLYVFPGRVMNADKSTRAAGPIGSLIYVGNRALRGRYGIFLNGFANGGAKGEGKAAATTIEVTGNTFGGDANASVLKKNFPDNTFLSLAEFTARVER